MVSHFSLALATLLRRRDLTTTSLAAIVGLHQVTISRLASHNRRLDVASLRALCTRLPNPRDGLDLLLAHLRDEVDRAGRLQTEVDIRSDSQLTPDDIRLLATRAQTDTELRAILHDLAELVRAVERRESAWPQRPGDSDLAAAEPPTTRSLP